MESIPNHKAHVGPNFLQVSSINSRDIEKIKQTKANKSRDRKIVPGFCRNCSQKEM